MSLPCIEQPVRCLLSSKCHENILTSDPDGNVFATTNRERSKEWFLVPESDGVVYIKSRSQEQFLSSRPEGGQMKTCIEALGREKWRIDESPQGGYKISSVEHGMGIVCDKNSVYTTDQNKDWETWNIEFQTGELCFISLPGFDKRIRCDETGKIRMDTNWKGWEVWRFIEADKGHVYISSWTHDTKFLCADPIGRVFTEGNFSRNTDKWIVEKAPDGCYGVVIKHSSNGKFLRSNGDWLDTSDAFERSLATWHLEAAHRQTYYISSAFHDKRISANKSTLSTTSNRKHEEEWKVNAARNGLITFVSVAHENYLGSDPDGQVQVVTNASKSEIWKIEVSPHCRDGVVLMSKEHKKMLTCDESGQLQTMAKQCGGSEIWRMEPCMPETVTEEQIKAKKRSMTVAAGVALASIVAMPFAVTGIIGAIGFGAEGVAAGSFAAGLMSAEAVAGGGAIAAGGTVATLQSIGAAGLGLAGTTAAMGVGGIVGGSVIGVKALLDGSEKSAGTSHDDEEGKKPMKNRPFCAWRSW